MKNTMKKKILITAAMLFAFCATTALAQVKIGYMDTNEVLSQLPKTKEIQATLNQLIQKNNTEFQTKAKAFQDAIASYQESQASMSSTEATETEAELQKMSNELQTLRQNFQTTVQQRRNELLLPVLSGIDKAIAAVAETEGLDLVINKSTNTGSTIIFYASEAQLDITNAVLQKAKTIIE